MVTSLCIGLALSTLFNWILFRAYSDQRRKLEAMNFHLWERFGQNFDTLEDYDNA